MASRHRTWRTAALGVGVALPWFAGCTHTPTVGGNEFTGRIQEGIQYVDNNGKRAAGFVQNYDVALENRVPAAIDYRVGLRSVITDTRLKSDKDSGLSPTQTYEPSVDLAYRNPLVEVESGASGLFTEIGDPGEGTQSFDRKNLYSRVKWNPIGLPSWRLSVEQTGTRSDPSQESDENEVELLGNHVIGPWHFGYAGTFDTLNDDGSGDSRDRVENLGRVDYEQEIDDEGTNLAAGVLVDRLDVRTDSGTSAAGPFLPPISGLFSIDTTPTNGTLDQLAALVDGDRTVSTGINIGGTLSGGGTDRNIGLDFGGSPEVQSVNLYTDKAVGATDASFYEWAVYRSDDNRIWRIVTTSAGFVYNTFLRRFEIRFDSVATRFVKIVNTNVPPAEGAIFVTEMEAFGVGTGGGNVLSRRQTDTAHVSFRFVPFDGFDVTTSALVGRIHETDEGEDTQDEKRLNLSVSGRYQPEPEWDVTLTGSTDETMDPVTVDRLKNLVTGLFSYRFWEGLETSLTASHERSTEDGDLDFESTSGGGRIGAEFGPELSTSLDVTRTYAKDADAGNRLHIWSTALLIFAKLTRAWQLNFDARWDSVDVSGATDLATPSQVILSPELIYRPGPNVLASADIEYRDGRDQTGLFHRYRLDWLPFGDGSVSVELNTTFEVLGQSGSGTRQGFVGRIVWNLTTRSYLELLGTDQRISEGDGNRVETLLVTYNLTF